MPNENFGVNQPSIAYRNYLQFDQNIYNTTFDRSRPIIGERGIDTHPMMIIVIIMMLIIIIAGVDSE